MKIYPIRPTTKPRMTQRDKWKNRDCVERYNAFKDVMRLAKFELPENSNYHIVFMFKMPESWSKKKKAANLHQKHTQTPDKDNLEKGVLDAIFKNDSHIWDGRVTKIWGESDCIIVKEIPEFSFDEFIGNYVKGII